VSEGGDVFEEKAKAVESAAGWDQITKVRIRVS
jgi:hypothetical protein